MKITELKNAAISPNPHQVEARKLYDTENAVVIHIMLKPGESMKRHITPVDVFFYVLEGKGTVEIGDEKVEAGQDTLIESPARIPHCLSNEGKGIFRVLVVKAPRPKESTKIL
ncbi:cupin domain-containing protein [bacterium]|nr:cupin domain-containing protein [bacterium]